jgi:hypothetical protein
MTAARLCWQPILEPAAEIVNSYDTMVTLRQVYCRLVAEGLIPNRLSSYNRLGPAYRRRPTRGRLSTAARPG